MSSIVPPGVADKRGLSGDVRPLSVGGSRFFARAPQRAETGGCFAAIANHDRGLWDHERRGS